MSLLPPPTLVDDAPGLLDLVAHLASCAAVGVDTESNSLHAYRERVCLIQFSTPTADFIVDPIGVPDLSPLAPFFASPAQEKIFHASEGDLLGLGRDFSFVFANIFDTMSAARTLGWPQVGLAAVLNAQFGVTLSKTHQRADWGRRPLKADMLDYARLDTRYLLPLRERLHAALVEGGHWAEAQEDFERLARDQPKPAGPSPDPMAFWRAKGARALLPSQAAILQAVFDYREGQARRINQPPFKVMGEAVLLELARRAPARIDDLSAVPGMTPGQLHRHGPALLAAIQHGLRAPAPPAPIVEVPPDEVLARYDRLHQWRKTRANARGVESDVILPRTTLRGLSERPPRSLDDLAGITDFGPRRRELYGEEILAVVSGRPILRVVATSPRVE